MNKNTLWKKEDIEWKKKEREREIKIKKCYWPSFFFIYNLCSCFVVFFFVLVDRLELNNTEEKAHYLDFIYWKNIIINLKQQKEKRARENLMKPVRCWDGESVPHWTMQNYHSVSQSILFNESFN